MFILFDFGNSIEVIKVFAEKVGRTAGRIINNPQAVQEEVLANGTRRVASETFGVIHRVLDGTAGRAIIPPIVSPPVVPPQ